MLQASLVSSTLMPDKVVGFMRSWSGSRASQWLNHQPSGCNADQNEHRAEGNAGLGSQVGRLVNPSDTGCTAIDAMLIPIGRGKRELIRPNWQDQLLWMPQISVGTLQPVGRCWPSRA